MKTIAISGRSNLFRLALVAGGLAALYLYRRNGGKMSTLVTQGRDYLNQARDFVQTKAPAIGSASNSDMGSMRSREISASPEQLDSMPAT